MPTSVSRFVRRLRFRSRMVCWLRLENVNMQVRLCFDVYVARICVYFVRFRELLPFDNHEL